MLCSTRLQRSSVGAVVRRHTSRPNRSSMEPCQAQPTRQLIALDFDGVVCDSVGESSLSAIKAAEMVWPEIFLQDAVQQRKDELVEKMRAVRPVVETGYENIVQIRCLVEGASVEEILAHWGTILPAHMEKWSLDRGELVQIFGRVRDAWIESDLPGWLAANRLYPGVADAVSTALQHHETYIVTTKQAHFTELLLKDMAGVPFPADKIYSQTVSGRPKAEVLQMLQQRHQDVTSYVFVEDKLSTLEKVAKVEDLSHWHLYLVDWGYNTVEERAKAAAHPNITVIDAQKFTSLLS